MEVIHSLETFLKKQTKTLNVHSWVMQHQTIVYMYQMRHLLYRIEIIVCVTEFSHGSLQVFWPLTESKNYFLHCLHVCFSLSTTEEELFHWLNLHETCNGTRKETDGRETTGKRKERSDPILKEMLRLGAKKIDLSLEEKAMGRRKTRTQHDWIQIVKRNRLVAFERNDFTWKVNQEENHAWVLPS